MKPGFIFITGTDTGVGKTVFAALLTRQLRERGIRVAGLKPICSGGRGDARALRQAAGNALALDQVNPWHFLAPVAPVLAARKESRRVYLRQVVAHIRQVTKPFEVVIVEGAGGLLSPLGEDFDSRDLLRALGAIPIVVGPNRLGAVNQVLLVLEALPAMSARKAQVVLVADARPDAASQSNAVLLGEKIGCGRIHELPRLDHVVGGMERRIQIRLGRLITMLR